MAYTRRESDIVCNRIATPFTVCQDHLIFSPYSAGEWKILVETSPFGPWVLKDVGCVHLQDLCSTDQTVTLLILQ